MAPVLLLFVTIIVIKFIYNEPSVIIITPVKYSGLSPQTNIVNVNNAFNVADLPQFRRARQQTHGFWQRSLYRQFDHELEPASVR